MLPNTELLASRQILSELRSKVLPTVPGLSSEAVHLLVATMSGAPISSRGNQHFYNGSNGQFRALLAPKQFIDINPLLLPESSWVYTNGTHFTDPDDLSVATKYRSAFLELTAGGGGWPDPAFHPQTPLLRRSLHRDICELSPKGWQTAWKAVPEDMLRRVYSA